MPSNGSVSLQLQPYISPSTERIKSALAPKWKSNKFKTMLLTDGSFTQTSRGRQSLAWRACWPSSCWAHRRWVDIRRTDRRLQTDAAEMACWLHATATNPLTGTLKPHSMGPQYRNTVIGTLTVDVWAVTFGTARRGLGGAAARPGPSSLYQM